MIKVVGSREIFPNAVCPFLRASSAIRTGNLSPS
jgi:hypothetical protein